AGESVARYGGEEIAIIMPAVPLEHAIQRAEQLRIKIQSLAIEHPASKTQRFVSVSIGVCCSSQFSNITSATLVESVDKALYRAKKQGRNQVAIAQ
ncbi:MAG: diguanylate cyclase, partial [Halioglobus sp.]|nr:diguanylate cyclase [Halioglobus sp.]